MTMLTDLRVNIGDDDGLIPSGIVPPVSSGLPIGTNLTTISELRVDIGDDDGIIPSGVLTGGIFVHNLLSPQHGDTTPASPSVGDLILGQNPTWKVLPSGDEGDALKVIGGIVQWAPDLSGSGALAAHIADPNAHHTRYTDAEASGVAVIVATTGINTAIVSHSADPDIHHTRYTDAEASGIAVLVATTGINTAIVSHSADPDIHHTRYTDAEASGVAVLVVTSGIAEHAAIPDVHHARYTDAEASGVAAGLITIHTADSGAHHDRYTDTEAAAVVESILATGVLDVAILQESGVELTLDATTTAVHPVMSTLLSVPMSLINDGGDLRVLATAAVNASAGVPVLFHIFIDGTFHRATTVNVTGAIDNAAIVIPRVAVSGSNPHTVDLRWAKFTLPLVTVRCLPSSQPNFYHASLSVQEIS